MTRSPDSGQVPADEPPGSERYVDQVTAGPGGVMTYEVGVITGDLTVSPTWDDDGRTARAAIQYTGADEWYTLSQSPAPIAPEGLAAYHRDILGRIRRGDAAWST
ncbi:hypothetical protein [Streptomyces acidicola]|uniref:Uncharacterized protein n=1 Tax=Streptomyces acidicola TaxID=2596892 RepID=A0A5N8WXF3_9ACTN|nr:hypothetical protein [Streptomyces acidicola]MPY51977.1 hypothetical protein [Streptomyces acidicola]